MLNKKIINLLNEESVSGESSGRASLYIRQEVLRQMFEKESTIKCFYWPTHMYIYK